MFWLEWQNFYAKYIFFETLATTSKLIGIMENYVDLLLSVIRFFLIKTRPGCSVDDSSHND